MEVRPHGEGAAIYRNGYEPRVVKTTSGPLGLQRPRVRDAGALGFESQVLGKGVARTHALEALIIVGFLRGLSVRDVEAVLEETFGAQVVSKSTVARVCQDTAERYRAWCQRRLQEHDVVFLYLDAIYLKRKLWPGAVEQRCMRHALMNITSRLPERHHREVKGPLLADPR